MSGETPTGAELVERLAAIGVEQREAQLFVHLCLQGPSRASDAAAATRLKRTETYRALESLMKRGFVTAHLTRPVVYEAVAPEALFAELLADHEQRREEISNLRERVVTAVREQGQRAGGSARHGYKIIQGRRAILAALEAATRNARSRAMITSTWLGTPTSTSQNRTYQTLLRRAAEGLPVRALLKEAPGLDRNIDGMLAHGNVKVRIFDPQHALRFAILDDKEIVYWLVSDPEPGLDARGDVAMWTNAPDFVRAQLAHFEALWSAGREPIRVLSGPPSRGGS